MGAINPFLGILSRGFQNFRDTPYLQDYISNLRPRPMSDVFVDQGRGSGIKNIPMEENIIPLSKPTSLYNLDDMLMSKPVSSKSPMADPMWGGIMNVDTGLINDYDPEDRSTWFDTHPATGEAVLKPETGYDYTDLNKRGYSAHEFDQRPWDKTQRGVRPYRYNYSEKVLKPPLWWKWLPKIYIMAKIVQTLTRASEDYRQDVAQSLVRDLDAVLEKLNTTFQEELKQEIEAKAFFME